MPTLDVTCFNTLKIARDGQPLTRWHSIKTRALFAYLAVEQGRPIPRETLAGLLWPDLTEKRARRNLSQNLMELRRSIGDLEADPPFLHCNMQTIEFNMASDYGIDVVAFAAHVKTVSVHSQQAHQHADAATCPTCIGALRQAVCLYSGPFLADFSIADSDLFENWVHTKREHFHQQAVEAFGALSDGLERQGEMKPAQAVVRRLLTIAPWQEEAHRQLMRLLALSGQRTQALAQYDACCKALEDELGVPPSVATDALYDQILVGELAPQPPVLPMPVPSAAQVEPSATPEIFVPDPPEPTHPPHLGNFVGRQAELTQYAEQLATHNVAVISGMAGVGKTALAVALANRWCGAQGSVKQIFWHTFYQAEGIMTLIWKLASFAAWHGQDQLWQMLQKARLTGGQPPPPESLFDYLLQLLDGHGYVLCLDDVHLLDDDPLLRHFMNRLQDLIASGDTQLVLTTRQIPSYLSNILIPSLSGLTAADMAGMVAQRDLTLDGAQLDVLYAYTEGNAQLVNLALDVLNGTEDQEQTLARLADADNIERFLLREVDENLQDDEREVLVAVALLLGYPGSRHALEAISDRSRIKGTLRSLTDRHLLTRQQSDEGDLFGAHAIVRAFYYDLPSRGKLQAMHTRAALYYDEEEQNRLRAALHALKAGDHIKAAKLATDDIWSIINGGEAWLLHSLLVDFQKSSLEPLIGVRVNLALGELQTFMGASEEARARFTTALDLLKTIPAAPNGPEIAARASLGMGNSFRYESSQTAVEWLHRGLKELDDADQESEGVLRLAAQLQISLGIGQMLMGHFAQAHNALEMGLDLLPAHPSRARVSALLNMGNVYYYQGDLTTAASYTQQALTVSQMLQDDFQTVVILLNLGIDQLTSGAWDASAASLEEALTLAKRLGDVSRQVEIELSIGILQTKRGDDEAAQNYLTHCLELTSVHGFQFHRFTIQLEQANLYLRQGQPEQAAPLLAENERLAEQIDVRHYVSELYRAIALMHLQLGDLSEALSYAQQAVDLARALTTTLEEGIGLRVLGEIFTAQEAVSDAVSAFEASLTLLADNDPYEHARTQLAMAELLLAQNDDKQDDEMQSEEAQSLLDSARAIFRSLGAKRELTTIGNMQTVAQSSTGPLKQPFSRVL